MSKHLLIHTRFSWYEWLECPSSFWKRLNNAAELSKLGIHPLFSSSTPLSISLHHCRSLLPFVLNLATFLLAHPIFLQSQSFHSSLFLAVLGTSSGAYCPLKTWCSLARPSSCIKLQIKTNIKHRRHSLLLHIHHHLSSRTPLCTNNNPTVRL
jgi:hypothetical protein